MAVQTTVSFARRAWVTVAHELSAFDACKT
jgi:hypothetical protein